MCACACMHACVRECVLIVCTMAYDSRYIYISIVGFLTATSRTEFERSLRGRNKELWYALLCFFFLLICRTMNTSKKINVLAFIIRAAIRQVGARQYNHRNIYFKEFVEQDGLGSRAQLPGMHTHYSSQKNITHCPIKMEQYHPLHILQKCLGTMSLYNNKAGGSIVYIK